MYSIILCNSNICWLVWPLQDTLVDLHKRPFLAMLSNEAVPNKKSVTRMSYLLNQLHFNAV